MSQHRYGRERGEGRSPIDIKLEYAAELEKWAKQEDRRAQNGYLPFRDREDSRKQAAKYRDEAARVLAKALAEEAECEADPARATGFELHTPRTTQLGRSLPTFYASKGGAVVSRRQAKKHRRW